MDRRDLRFSVGRLAVLLALLGLLASCASPTATTFSKPGMTAADRERDENSCLRQSIGHKDGVAILLPFDVDRDAFKSCMQARGYAAGPAK